MSSESAILELTESNFEKEVITRSLKIPVVVDFWAEWCAPCRSLTPILEAAIANRADEVVLAKIDVDQNANLAAKYNVRGIPAVKAFYQGAIVEEFNGMLDPQGVELFLDRVCPSPEERALLHAERLLADGSPAKAEALLQPVTQSRRHKSRASMLLAKAAQAKGDVVRAKDVLQQIEKSSPHAAEAAAMLLALDLLEAGAERNVVQWRAVVAEDPENLDLLWGLAAGLYRDEDYDEALATFLEIVKKDRAFREDGARKAMLALFDQLGPQNELCGKYRRKLQIYI
jgi:putative thioredoxin